jgi:hypothetical protein
MPAATVVTAVGAGGAVVAGPETGCDRDVHAPSKNKTLSNRLNGKAPPGFIR